MLKQRTRWPEGGGDGWRVELDQHSGSSDPYRRKSQVFPRLHGRLLEIVRGYGREETVGDGERLFQRGQRSTDFLVVLEGLIEVLGRTSDGGEEVIGKHQAGQFTGEIDMFNSRAIMTSARASGETRLVRISRAQFRRLIASEQGLGETITRAFILRRMGLVKHQQAGTTLIGLPDDPETLRIRAFLTRNDLPHRYVDGEAREAQSLLSRASVRPDDLPVLLLPDGEAFLRPSNAEVADTLGLTELLDRSRPYDVAVVGAGPAGLAAAVYAASEGLDTVVLERFAPGGQAGSSSRIENYLGFPTGVSGQALAGRGQVQAQKFGAKLAIARAVVGFTESDGGFVLTLEGGTIVRARAAVVATGARWRRLGASGAERFEGRGLHYAATSIEAQLCSAQEVVVVGGANAAGQAAVFLAASAARVHLVVRADAIESGMSEYLVTRIRRSPRIEVHLGSEVIAIEGDDQVRRAVWTNGDGKTWTRAVGAVFVMIGADPNTEWLGGYLELDEKAYIRTGSGVRQDATASPYATSRPGVFAVGDVRSGSVKRVASSVGEGSVVVSAIHEHLSREGSEVR